MGLLWLRSGVSVRENPAPWVLGSGEWGGAHPGHEPQWGEKGGRGRSGDRRILHLLNIYLVGVHGFLAASPSRRQC